MSLMERCYVVPSRLLAVMSFSLRHFRQSDGPALLFASPDTFGDCEPPDGGDVLCLSVTCVQDPHHNHIDNSPAHLKRQSSVCTMTQLVRFCLSAVENESPIHQSEGSHSCLRVTTGMQPVS